MKRFVFCLSGQDGPVRAAAPDRLVVQNATHPGLVAQLRHLLHVRGAGVHTRASAS